MRLTWALLLLIGTFSGRGQACFCVPFETNPCQLYQRTGAVFAGFVTRVESLPNSDNWRVQVHVSEAFRGMDEKDVEIVTARDSCGVKFEEHASYLIYAGFDAKTHQFSTWACSGTKRIEDADAELGYLRGLKTGASKASVFGFVTSNPDVVIPVKQVSKPVAGVSVTLRTSEQSWRAITDSEGRYEIADLPAGAYELSADLPNSTDEQRLKKFALEVGQCSFKSFLSIPVGLISGQLLDVDGNPVADQLVDIVAVPPTPQPHPLIRHFTDKQGRFVHTSLEAGRYVLGFNLDSPPNARDWYGKRIPYGAIYYPGVTDRSAAAVVQLESGQRIEDLEFRLPAKLKPATFSGSATLPDGSPADTDVWLMDTAFPDETSQVDSVETDSAGSFSLIGVERRPYVLFAHEEQGDFHVHSEVASIEEPKPVRLVLSIRETAENCTICKRFTRLWQPRISGARPER